MRNFTAHGNGTTGILLGSPAARGCCIFPAVIPADGPTQIDRKVASLARANALIALPHSRLEERLMNGNRNEDSARIHWR